MRSLGAVVWIICPVSRNEMPSMWPRSCTGRPSRWALTRSRKTNSPSPLTMTSTAGNSRKTRSAWCATCVPPNTTHPSGFIRLYVSASDPKARKFQPSTEQAKICGHRSLKISVAIAEIEVPPPKLNIRMSASRLIRSSASAVDLR